MLRFNGSTGEYIDDFVAEQSGGLSGTTGLTFGPDGHLYVASGNERPGAQNILRYDGSTGVFLGVFAEGGGLSGPYGLTFGPDGNLYVSSQYTNSILRYDGTTGAFIDEFVSSGSGGLSHPSYIIFTPAPGALILGTIGLSFSGWLLRKRKIAVN